MEVLHDKTLICIDCGKKFTFTVKDQIFYKKNQFVEPKRCRDCRMKNKLQKQQRERTYA